MKNGLTTSLLFFLENAKKIWVGWTTLNGKKEREREDALGLIKQVSLLRLRVSYKLLKDNMFS